MTRSVAEYHIRMAAQYLAQQEAQPYPPPGLDEDLGEWREDPQHWDDAAAWSHLLLQSANRDGHYGCRLCRS